MDTVNIPIKTETFFPTSTPAMVEELRAQNEILHAERSGFEMKNEELQAKVTEMTSSVSELQNQIGQYAALITRMNRNVRDFADQLKELYRNGQFDEETACALAAPFDIQLTEELQVCITVTYRGTADVPINMNPDDIEWTDHVAFSFDHYQSDIMFDIYEDDIEVEVA